MQDRIPAAAGERADDWTLAAAQLKSVEEIEFLGAALFDCECQETDCPTCNPLHPGEQRTRIEAVVAQNGPALRVFDQGLVRGALQIPVAAPDLSHHCDLVQNLRGLIRLKALQADLEQANGNADAASTALAQILDAGRLTMLGDGLLVDYLVGMAFVGVSISAVEKLLQTRALCLEILRQLRQATAAIDFESFLARALQAEFAQWALPTIEHFDNLPKRCGARR